jgi:hypothetical protein
VSGYGGARVAASRVTCSPPGSSGSRKCGCDRLKVSSDIPLYLQAAAVYTARP